MPTLGHLPVGLITAGLVDRAIDAWEREYGRSTVKNTVAVLVLVLDEAVRDGIMTRNPAKDRARRKTVGRSVGNNDKEQGSPRDLALPDVPTLDRLVSAVVQAGDHQSWDDMVTILATTALRISEVSGLRVGDVDLDRGLLHVFRQTYPGRGDLITKETKGRRRRTVPIIDPLRPTLERLIDGRRVDARLPSGPRGGVITTATLRDATNWDQLVRDIGQPGPVRHGLRHTALTWMADAGVELHILQRVAGQPGPGRHLALPTPRRAGDARGRRPILGLVVPLWFPAPDARGRAQRPNRSMKSGSDVLGQARCKSQTAFHFSPVVSDFPDQAPLEGGLSRDDVTREDPSERAALTEGPRKPVGNPAVGGEPTPTYAGENRVERAATTTSAASSTPRPAPATTPWTAPTTGFEEAATSSSTAESFPANSWT